MQLNCRKGEEETTENGMRSVKNEDQSSDSGELCNSILENCRRAESAEREMKEATSGNVARFAKRELDYIAEMYCANYDIFHKSSLGGGRAKEAIAVNLATGEYGGVYTYGGLDKENCGDVIAYENLTSATYWQFRV
ncbi:hypothetical protein COOONC_26283, partial [Cooperia oncophora]